MFVYRLLVTLGLPLGWLIFRPRVRGKENVPRRGGFVVSPTHLSGLDALAISYALTPRVVRNMGKNELFRRPLLGPFVRSMGAFPARDGDGVPGGVAAAAELAKGGSVV